MPKTIHVEGLDTVLANLHGTHRDMQATINAEMHITGEIVSEAVKRAMPKDTGNTADTAGFLVGHNSLTIFVKSAVAYFLEFGTGPHTPPLDALRGWAARHGIPVGAVQRAISSLGTAPQPFFWPTINRYIPLVTDRLQRISRWR